jgi:hypothetical protein
MIGLARGVFPVVDSLWSVPSVIGANYQAMILEQGAVPGDTSRVREFIQAGGRVLLTAKTPQDLCGSTSLLSISGWIGASAFSVYTGSGIPIVSTYEQPFGSQVHQNDTLGTAVSGYGRLITLGANATQVARLGSSNLLLAAVYCATGAGHCLYYTGGAGISPESDSLLAGFLANPALGVSEDRPEMLEPGPDEIRAFFTPNPWHRELAIRFHLKSAGPVRLEVFNITGQRVRKWEFPEAQAGWNVIRWNGESDGGRPLPGGVYFSRIQAGEATAIKKTLLFR